MLTLFVFTDLRELISSLIVDAQCVMARALGFFLSAPKQREIVTRSLRFVGLNRPVADLLAVGGSLATALLIAIALVALPTRMAAQDQARTADPSSLATVLPDQDTSDDSTSPANSSNSDSKTNAISADPKPDGAVSPTASSPTFSGNFFQRLGQAY
ncbi:MAG TPA: hypothetical protein VF772_27880, partial [Terriglobales bacterium]